MEPILDQNPPAEPAENKAVIQINLDEAAGAVKRASYWFFWIAALSFINTLLVTRGTYFIMGLATTQIVDGIVQGATGEVNYFISLIVPLIFVGIGILAGKMHRWAFIVGAIIYLLDGILYIMFEEWLAILFHVYVLYKLYQGFRLITEYEEIKNKLSAIEA